METTKKGWIKVLVAGMAVMVFTIGIVLTGCKNPSGGGVDTNSNPSGGVDTDDNPSGGGVDTDDNPSGGGVDTDDNTVATQVLTVMPPTFGEVSYGYATRPAAKAITISNSGTGTATISNVALSVMGAFELGGSGNTVNAGVSIDTWTIQPKAELAVGTHTATITVTYDGTDSPTAAAEVSFTVNAAVLYAWVNEHDQIVTSIDSPTLSCGASEPLIMSVTGSGYSNYLWSYNGRVVTGATTNSYTFDSTGKPNGIYNIGLQVKKDGAWYSTLITITVTD